MDENEIDHTPEGLKRKAEQHLKVMRYLEFMDKQLQREARLMDIVQTRSEMCRKSRQTAAQFAAAAWGSQSQEPEGGSGQPLDNTLDNSTYSC